MFRRTLIPGLTCSKPALFRLRRHTIIPLGSYIVSKILSGRGSDCKKISAFGLEWFNATSLQHWLIVKRPCLMYGNGSVWRRCKIRIIDASGLISSTNYPNLLDIRYDIKPVRTSERYLPRRNEVLISFDLSLPVGPRVLHGVDRPTRASTEIPGSQLIDQDKSSSLICIRTIEQPCPVGKMSRARVSND